MKQPIDEYIQTALSHFGKEVNTNRQLVLDKDGLKSVYRRVIYTALGYGSKLTKTAAISGSTIATLHPHSSDAVDAVISALVRWGIFQGQGNHGIKMIYGDDIMPSASRYTEACVDPKWIKIFQELLPYVPYKEGELEGNMEPEYLPTPLPLTLLFSGLGISYGTNAKYPMFTAESMLRAILNDNPYELDAPFGLKINYDESELWDLWDKGLGRICYEFNVQRCGISAGYGTMITGSPELFKPQLEQVFAEQLMKGQVYILDQSHDDLTQVFVGRSPNVRAISDDDVYDMCCEAASSTKMFRLTVTDGDSAHIIPLRDWLMNTFNNYIEVVEKFKADRISKLEFDHQVFSWLPTVAQCQIDNRTWEVDQISKHTGCDVEVCKAILKKSISTLRKADSSDKLKSIEDNIKYYKNLDARDYTIDLINQF